MKIQLQSLRVVNCGPLDNVCIEFNTNGDSPVTVLAGANGSGKTTVLRLIAALANTLSQPSMVPADEDARLLDSADYVEMSLLVDNERFDVFYGQEQDDDEEDQNDRPRANYFGTTLAIRHNRMAASLRRRTNRVMDGHIQQKLRDAIREQEDKLLIEEDRSKFQEQGADYVPSILYFPHERGLIRITGRAVRREHVKYKWVYGYESSRAFAQSLDSYLIWQEYAEPELYARTIDFLNSLDLEGKKFSVERKELRAIVTTKDGQTHGVAELSSGEQNILIIMAELRRRLLPYSIVLIDEIENSLHVAYQHLLGQGLKQLQKQIPFQLIVTTHSTEIARIFGAETVRILTEF